MGRKSAPIDFEIARIARVQHGIVTARQLAEMGLQTSAISKRARTGRLHRLHQGVYAVGHEGLVEEARWRAAVLACGPGAALSHGAAAVHWELLRPLDGLIDVTVPTHGGRKRRRGLRIHRCATFGAPLRLHGTQKRPVPLVTVRDRIPVTTVPRTLKDLPSTLAPYLPIGGMTVDFLWRDACLVVETDSYATHGGTVAFEDDRERDMRLRRLGFAVHHFSERQLELEPAAVAADVAAALRLTGVA